MILRRILEKEGYLVNVASDGEKALSIVEKNNPDVVILDLMMPGMNGREVCHAIREMAPATKVIYFSAKVESDVQKLKELKGEADMFLTKPATSKKILSSVNSLLNQKDTEY
ncbi:MAG: response regulator [Dehalococcoidales bacterium]|jgi:two-component system alkaline phosphatase synthesis response regulator PhoP|nr:response regulator [Dehalococcoidales bacterium]